MTVSLPITKTVSFVTPGAQLVFVIPSTLRFFADENLVVAHYDAGTGVYSPPLILNADYTVQGANTSYATVTLLAAVPAGKSLYIERDIILDQETDFTNLGAFYPELHEDALDLLTVYVSDVADALAAIEVGVDGDYLPLAGGVMTGAIGWDEAGETATIDMVPDPNSASGNIMTVESIAGVQVKAPNVVLDTDNLQITMAGAQVNSAITVAGIDAFGVVSLGYTVLPPPGYSVTDTTTTPITIKTAGQVPPTPWVFLGLSVLLTQDIAAGTGNISFEGIFANPTVNQGVLEFGLRVNGGAVVARDIVVQISAQYNQTIATQLPLVNGYLSGDVIDLMARVPSNGNNGFTMSMLNSPTDVGVLRITGLTSGTGGGGGVNSVGGISPVMSSGGANPQISMTTASTSASGYLTAANFTTFNNKANANGTNATGNWPINITGIANHVDNINSASALSLWTGTVDEYNSIPTKNANVVYIQKA